MVVVKKLEKFFLERFFLNDIDKLWVIDLNYGFYLFKGFLIMYKDGRYFDVILKIGEKWKV